MVNVLVSSGCDVVISGSVVDLFSRGVVDIFCPGVVEIFCPRVVDVAFFMSGVVDGISFWVVVDTFFPGGAVDMLWDVGISTGGVVEPIPDDSMAEG